MNITRFEDSPPVPNNSNTSQGGQAPKILLYPQDPRPQKLALYQVALDFIAQTQNSNKKEKCAKKSKQRNEAKFINLDSDSLANYQTMHLSSSKQSNPNQSNILHRPSTAAKKGNITT